MLATTHDHKPILQHLRHEKTWSRLQSVQRYQALSAGAEAVESRLQLSLVEYLNAEIFLQTVRDLPQALQVRRCQPDDCTAGPTIAASDRSHHACSG